MTLIEDNGAATKISEERLASDPHGKELVDCIELPVLVVDRDLALITFNPAAAALLSLSASDQGRKLHSVEMFARVQNLQEVCEHVIASGSSHRMEVADAAGSCFSLNVGCYKTNNQNSDGAVLTLTNVTAFRESLELAIKEREYTKAVINTIADALIVVDAELRVQAANQAFYSLLQTSRDLAQGAHLYQLGSRDWDILRLRTLLAGSSLPNGDLGTLECDLELLGVGRRTLLLNARRLIRGSHAGQLTLIAIQDITERKRAMEALRESEEELRILHRVGATLASELDLKKLVQVVTDAGRDLSQASFGAFFHNVSDDQGESYMLYTLSGAPVEAFKKYPMPRNTSLFGPTFAGDKTIRIDDVLNDPRYGKSAPYHGMPPGHLPVRSYLAVPVISRSGEVLGGLFYGHPQVGVFTERAERLVEGLASQAAIAMDNARLFDAMRNQRTRAEESEERLRLAQQVAKIGTFEWNLQNNVNRWTPELESMYGLPPGGFTGAQQAWEQLLHPEDRASAVKQVEISIESGTPQQAEWRVIWPDGSIHWLLGRWRVFKDEAGTPTRMTGINIDITSRKAAEDAQRRLAAIVASSDDAIVSKDLNGIVTSWNRAAERIFGYTAPEMIGRHITTIIPSELHEDEPRILQTIARGERIEHFETVRVKKGGERIDVSVTISPLRDEAGRIIGAAKIARDITQYKKTEHALRVTERLASVGRLAATVAHEINNPLEAVTNLVYLAHRSTVPDDVRRYLASAEEELDRVAHLTKQTLGFYRETTEASAVRLGAIVDPLISVFAGRTRNKAIQISTDIRENPEIYAVPGELRQLTANLLSNSIDAVGAGGRIRIRVSAATARNGRQSPGVRLTIADSGPGIPSVVRSKLFEPFFTTKRDVGTGLGLWVCKNIVEKHHGSIRVKSSTTPGSSWTVFSVFLPLGRQKGTVESRRQAI